MDPNNLSDEENKLAEEVVEKNNELGITHQKPISKSQKVLIFVLSMALVLILFIVFFIV
ncbi:MAG: hypothetical protein ABGX51_02390 [Gammaproteobacteria bacterium]|jgi:uncharacterized membrane protein YvbJ